MAAVYKTLSKKVTAKPVSAGDANKKNKQRVLILSSRGVTFRHRHLMHDLAAMLPHGRVDSKFDSKTKLFQLNELAELYNCNNVLFFEARKGKDLYLWMSKVPNGPTVKLFLQNLHTMEELNFTGNCLKGSRPILSFDSTFEKEPFLRLIKEMLMQIFGVPQQARKSKPFIDHIMGFSIADGKIWVRNYQINEVERIGKDDGTAGEEPRRNPAPKVSSKESDINLVEIGPRLVMTPIIIQEGSFGGPIIYENRQFVSPNQVRSEHRRARAGKHNMRAERQRESLAKKGELGLRTNGGTKKKPDALDNNELFA